MKKKLERVKTGALSRGFSLARASLSIGAKTASHAVGSLFSAEGEAGSRAKALLLSQVERLARELGELKGTAMKAGQMFSVFGEHFLPPEVNRVLSMLRDRSPSLAWPSIEDALRSELPPERMRELEIEEEPLASASIGQVHRARRKSDGLMLCLKVQYPGVADSIDSDLSTLRKLLTLARLLPEQAGNEGVFQEVREMLLQEVDYARELALTEEYRALVGADPRFVIPRTFPEYSSKRVLATEYFEGLEIESDEVRGFPQARRNAIGISAHDLFFRELFVWGVIQTDPHAGNYRVLPGSGGEPDRLLLLDFGAVRKYPEPFLNSYREMTWATLSNDRKRAIAAASKLGLFREGDSPETLELFYEMCALFMEPFQSEEPFIWKGSGLPQRAAKMGRELALSMKLRAPPREVVFLDRKLVGTFTLLSILDARFSPRSILLAYRPPGYV